MNPESGLNRRQEFRNDIQSLNFLIDIFSYFYTQLFHSVAQFRP